MSPFKKLNNNVLSRSAVGTLGIKMYARYLVKVIEQMHEVIGSGNLSAVDREMAKGAKDFYFRGARFRFDCEYCDAILNDGSFTFGIVREVYIRDCYFKWQPDRIFDRARIVVDLGANRGAFSSLMTARADFILCVEAQSMYLPLIDHNLRANNFRKFALEEAMVGAGGLLSDKDSRKVTIEGLLDQYNLAHVDFLKMDVEGSEFSLFENPQWLTRIGALSMEVHRDHGDPNAILLALRQFGFECAIADEAANKIRSVEDANFIYAWKRA